MVSLDVLEALERSVLAVLEVEVLLASTPEMCRVSRELALLVLVSSESSAVSEVMEVQAVLAVTVQTALKRYWILLPSLSPLNSPDE